MLEFCDYKEEFLVYSWEWLNDKEIKELTMTPNFTKEQQKKFYLSLKEREDYIIYGLKIDDKPVGACGLKNIREGIAEYWGYIGEKKYWGKGYGAKIINEMISIAEEKKISNLYLKVTKNNVRAIKLYLNMGFLINEDLSTNNILYMTKVLL